MPRVFDHLVLSVSDLAHPDAVDAPPLAISAIPGAAMVSLNLTLISTIKSRHLTHSSTTMLRIDH